MPPEVAPGVIEHPELDAGPTAHPELGADEVKSLALRGFGALVVRTVGQRGLQMAGNILLARWLAPETFGIYAIVSFVVGMAGFLSDLGLGASLIQRREHLTERDLRTAFSLSLILNVVVVGTLWAVAGPLVRAYDLQAVNVLAVRMLAASILFSTFTVIPSIRMERELKFGRLSMADLSGQLVYVLIAVPLAFSYRHPNVSLTRADDAVWCFVWATLASRVVHAVVVNISAWWRPRLGFDRGAMRAMLAFGLPYQLNGFVNAIKDNFVPTFIAFVAGTKAVGYVIWAVGMATNALFLLPIVSRVTFPAYARLQHDPPALKDAIEKSIKWVAATVFPTTLLLAALARQIVEHVYGPKWFPGLTSFYLLCIPMMNAAYSTVIVSALYGLGRARTVLRLTLIWAVAGWAVGVPMTLWIGKDGFALAMCAVSWLSVLSVREMNKVVRVNFVRPLLRVFVLSAIPAAVVGSFARFVVHDSLQLALVAAVGVLGYLGLMFGAGELDDVRAMIRRARTPVASVRPSATEAVTDRA